MDRILVLERVLANAIMIGARNFANLWLLPSAAMVGERIGIRAESQDDGWWWWFYTARLKLQLPELAKLQSGDLGTVKVKRVAKAGELGRSAFGPAVWVFSEPLFETVKGRAFRAGYSDQAHVRERDKLTVGSCPESEAK